VATQTIADAPAARARRRYRRMAARAGSAALAACLAAALGVGAAEPDPQATTAPVGSVPQRVMTELRAANAARAQRLQEQQDWALRKHELELLASVVRDQAQQAARDAAEAKRERARLQKQAAGVEARQAHLEQVEAMIDALAERLEKALAALATRSLPGLVPADRASAITDPAGRLAAAADRVAQAQRQTHRCGVELVVGDLDGQATTVKLLRAGGVAAWWMSLDATRSGTATVEEGKLMLSAARTPADVAAIRKAFDIAEARAAPDWVLLPAQHVGVAKTAGDRP